MRERDWQQTILDAAKALNWRCYHTHDSRNSAAGFPDLVCVRGEHIAFLELKNETRKVTPEQQAWLDAIAGAREIFYGVVRPSDWDDVEAFLKGSRGQ